MKQSKIGKTSITLKESISQIQALLPKFSTQYLDMWALTYAVILIALIGLLIRRILAGKRPRKRLNENGYVVRTSESGQDRYEHREVAEEILGRRLEKWEVVHHINGRRTDNRIKNLCVMNYSDHDRYHGWYDWIFKTYGNYPRREAQLRKLREEFNGKLLIDFVNERNRSA
jgi:hypothetical protein